MPITRLRQHGEFRRSSVEFVEVRLYGVATGVWRIPTRCRNVTLM